MIIRAVSVAAFLLTTLSLGLAGCSEVDDEEEDESAQSSEALRQGGCSMSTIRELQRYCRRVCPSSRGLDYCYTVPAGPGYEHFDCAC